MLIRHPRRLLTVIVAVIAAAAGVTAAVLAGSGSSSAAAPAGASYASAPTLHPPVLSVSGPTPSGLSILSSPASGESSLLISDGSGQPVWFKTTSPDRTLADLHVATLDGQPVLVYFDGTQANVKGYSTGAWHVLNSAYQQIATITASGPGVGGADLHDIALVGDGTAYVEAYVPVQRDLSAQGGSATATVLEDEIERVNIATGAVLFDWKSLDHIPVTDSFMPLTTPTVDYIHVNSLAVDPADPNLLIVSGRHLSQVFAIDVRTGSIAWSVGGRHPTLALQPGAADTLTADGVTLPFSYQHDASLTADGVLSVLDNGDQRPTPYSRAAFFQIDAAAGTVTELNDRQLVPSPSINADSQGDVQTLSGGGTLIGWGSAGGASYYGPDGTLAAHIGGVASYRVFLQPWHGQPSQPPSIAVRAGGSGVSTVAASWNGATDVARWQVLSGPDADHLTVSTGVARAGFETSASVATPAAVHVVAVRALSSTGAVLGTSAVTTVG